MNYKTKMLVDRFAGILSQWPGVECVTLNEAALPDMLDPYFALIMDVFFSGEIPGAQQRCALYGDDVAAFESSAAEDKDRFLIGDAPVRLEFKGTGRVEELVSIADTRHDSLWLVKDSGTYGFYRLAHGEVVFSRGAWIYEIRERLGNVGEQFWVQTRAAAQSKMEHFLSDLGAAFFQGDEFHYLIASAGFIKSACCTLFCVNRCFEPSHRAYFKQVLELPLLPDLFRAEFEGFLSTSSPANMEQRFMLAKKMALAIIKL